MKHAENLIKSTKNDFLNLNFAEKVFHYEIYLSQKILTTNHLNFNLEKCCQELQNLNVTFSELILNNVKFFDDLYAEIHSIIHSKKYITNFKLGLEFFDTIAYTVLIVKSLQYTNDLESIDRNDNMLHRNIVKSNIKKHSQCLFLLNLAQNVENNCFKILILLEKKNIIGIKKITTRKQNKIKTDFFLKLIIPSKLDFSLRLPINYSKFPYRRLKDCYISESYLTLHQAVKKSNRQFTINRFSYEPLDILSSRPIYIDFSKWDLIRNFIFTFYAKKYPTLALSIEKINDLANKIIEARSLENKNKYLKQEYLKDTQRLYYFLAVEKILKIEFPIYFSYYYDFRGRIYSTSNLDPLYLKFLRPFYILKSIKNKENIIRSKYYLKILEENIVLPKKLNDVIRDNVDKYFIIVLLMELGKLAKTNEDGLKNLIERGYSFHCQKPKFENLEDLIYYNNINDSLNNFLTNRNIEDVTIIRDSTASTLQHWCTILKPKSFEVTNRLNIDGNNWYDVYTIIIEKFLLNYHEQRYDKDPIISKCLNRKVLKKLIMTINYNAGIQLCRKYLINELQLQNKHVSERDYDLFIQHFHKYINNELFKELFCFAKTDFLEKNSSQTLIEGESINLFYLNSIEKKKIIKFADKRWIFSEKKLQNSTDRIKTQMALPANIIHAYDAKLARYLIKNVKCFTIHDSFGTSIFDIHQLMDFTNKYFNTELTAQTYGLFILI